MAGVGLHVWVLNVTEPRLRAQPLASLAKPTLLRLGPQRRWRIWALTRVVAGDHRGALMGSRPRWAPPQV